MDFHLEAKILGLNKLQSNLFETDLQVSRNQSCRPAHGGSHCCTEHQRLVASLVWKWCKAVGPSKGLCILSRRALFQAYCISGLLLPPVLASCKIKRSSNPTQCQNPCTLIVDDASLVVGAWYRLAACKSGDAPVDVLVQIGVRSQFKGPTGQILLFFGNKADAFLERLLCVVPPTPQFAFQLGSVPGRLEPKKQIQVNSIDLLMLLVPSQDIYVITN